MQETQLSILKHLFVLVQTMHSLSEVCCQSTTKRAIAHNVPALDVLYARVFSYDGVLDDLTTGFVMVSALYGLDCQNQLQHHMKGMLWNGATRQDLFDLQTLCLSIAESMNVKFRNGPAPIPVLPE